MNKIMLSLLLVLLSACSATTYTAPLPEDQFLIIAHRGASAYAPEHSLLAYELAVQMQADYIELDVQQTRDDELIAMHDSFIVSNGSKRAVSDFTFQELKEIPRSSGFDGILPVSLNHVTDPLRIVSTEEIFDHFGTDVNYYIEIKTTDSNRAIEKELLRQLHMYDLLPMTGEKPSIIVQSFHPASLQYIHAEEPDIPLIQLYSQKKESMLTKRHLKKVAAYASGIGVEKSIVTKQLVERAHSAGLHLHPYTVNDNKEIRTMIQLGVDGIFTDVPDIAKRMLDEQ